MDGSVIQAVPHQIKTDKMQYMKVNHRLPTTNIFV